MGNEETSQWQSHKRSMSSLFVATTPLLDSRRQEAFGSLYSVMKIIDDLSDSVVESTDITTDDADMVRLNIRSWQNRVKFCYHTVNDSSRIDLSLLKAITRFEIPEFLWVDFFQSLTMELDAAGFQSIRQLKDYAKGTAIVPVTMFLIIIFSEPDSNGIYKMENQDEIFAMGESLGTWIYILHTLLMEKAYLMDTPSRNLLPLDFMADHGILDGQLSRLAYWEKVDSPTRNMIVDYIKYGEKAGKPGRDMARKLTRKLPSDRRKALAILITIYIDIQKRIMEMEFNIFSPEPIWEPQDRMELLRKVETYDANFDLTVLW